MPSRLTHIEHVFSGGWAPDYGASAVVSVEKDGRCEIPWLMAADNLEYEADGTPHKIGGSDRLFNVALEGGASVRGLHDFWRQGSAGSPLQNRVIHVGTKVKADDGDGVFADIFTGLQGDSIPHYSTFEGQLIIAQTGQDMPMYTDGITYTTMSSPTPNFAFSESHKLRQWAAGVDAAPSSLFYSAQEDPTDWTGDGSGDIAISPGDGDRITAVASHRNELFVFKGPHRGSIHRISGSAPIGESDPFARNDFIPTGLGAVGQRSIFRFGNDLGFMWSDGSFHSLNTTEKYGDFLETALSRPLNRWLRRHVSASYLEWASAVTSDSSGVVRIAIPVDGSGTNSVVVSMDFRFDPPRWSRSPVLVDYCQCLASVRDHVGSTVPSVMGGGNDGRVRRLYINTRTFALMPSGYAFLLSTPFLSYVQSPRRSTLYFGGVRVAPKTAQYVTFSWVRDGYTQQSNTFVQWTGDILGPITATPPISGATQFTLGTSTLAGERAITRSLDLTDGGEFQQIQYSVSNGGIFNDIHVKSILSSIKPGAVSTEEMT